MDLKKAKIWVEVTGYCDPWHDEYENLLEKISTAVSKWYMNVGTDKAIYYKYPISEVDDSLKELPTHLGFDSEEDAIAFKLMCEI